MTSSARIASLVITAALSGITFGPALTSTSDDTSWTTDTSTDGTTTCQPYTWEHHTAGVAAGETDAGLWGDLLSLGWRGTDDGMDALYAPECQ